MSELTVQNATNIEWAYGHFDSEDASVGTPILSPTFSTPCSTPSKKLVNVEWRLWLYPRGRRVDFDDDYVALGLENSTDIQASAKFEVTLQSESGDILCKSCATLGKPGKGETWLVHKLAKSSSVEEFLMNFGTARDPLAGRAEELTVLCSISDVSTVQENDLSVHVPEHYESLLETGKFGDVMFNVGEKSMRLHKNILTSASEVFRAMFDHEMREQKESVVDVVDVDFDVMKEMLRYIYTRRVNGIEKIAVELFVVADRYSVEGLKLMCEKQLVDKLGTGNALNYFEMCVKYNMAHLKAEVLEFLVYHMKELVGTSEFKELSSECKDQLFGYIATKTLIIDGP